MATVCREILLKADPDTVWAALRDVGAVHERLVPGVLADTRMEGRTRVVTFASGLVVRERIVTVDDRTRRLVYASVDGRAAHHNASFQVYAANSGGTRLVWITDVLPDELAGPIGETMAQCTAVIEKVFEN